MSIIKFLKSQNKNLIAIDTEKEKISYKYLWDLVSKTARFISNLNETKVILLCEEKILSYIFILACIKEKKTYVPLSPNLSKKRILEIIKITNSTSVINLSKTKKKINNIKVFNIKNLNEIPQKKRKTKKIKNLIAYIIFTSGSTGIPKGVSISYRSLQKYLFWLNLKFKNKKIKKISQYSDLSFDLSVMEIFGAFASGSTLCPIQEEYYKTYPLKFIKKNKIDCWISVPSIVDLMMLDSKNFKSILYLKNIFFCGEPLLKKHLDFLYLKNCKINVFNTYGPTEFTVSCSEIRLNKSNYKNKILNSVSIGRPISGTKFLINGNLNKGELLISGDQLFSNYLNMRQEYNNKIIKIKNRKYYRSGDIFLKKGGNYYFINRNDRQIKRKGYRIELEEIDNLIRLKKVEFVYSFQNKKGKIVTLIKNKMKIDLNKTIKNKLPNYFMPDIIKYIDKIEYNQNNKVNYKKLEKLNSL